MSKSKSNPPVVKVRRPWQVSRVPVMVSNLKQELGKCTLVGSWQCL